MDNYQETIISSAPINEIETYLNNVTREMTSQNYVYDDCVITIERTWIEKMGSLHFHRSQIVFLGSEASVIHCVKAFRLRFLSAGG